MKKELRTSIPKLELKNGQYEGGFSLLPKEQLSELKGGTTNTCQTNPGCTIPPANNCINISCSGS